MIVKKKKKAASMWERWMETGGLERRFMFCVKAVIAQLILS